MGHTVYVVVDTTRKEAIGKCQSKGQVSPHDMLISQKLGWHCGWKAMDRKVHLIMYEVSLGNTTTRKEAIGKVSPKDKFPCMTC